MDSHKVVELRQDLEASYRDYAMETIIDRALPRVEDGLKPVHRRILYAMHTMGLDHHKAHKKSARVVGEVLGKYHPHGDSSVYMAMVRMAQDFSLREMLVDGQGNFGSIDGDAPAAMRYTEARLAAIAAEMVRDIERGTVDWVENFDGSLKEPVILPATLPNLLVNGSSGVAVGMATNMPPHNLGEVCDGLVYVANRWDKRDRITVDELLRLIPGPDFPTGGVAYRYRFEPGRNGDGDQTSDTIRDAYESGRGRIVTQARVDIEPASGGKADIVVTELPYMVQKSTVLEKIAKEVRDGRISGVTDLRDESDYTGMRIVIEAGRGSDPREVLDSLLTYTQLRQTFGVINLALVEQEGEVLPGMLSLREILVRFVAHRLNVIVRRGRHELAEREVRLHIVKGLLKALDVIDEIIATIKKSKTTDTARTNLMKQFGFSEAQAGAILSMQLRRLAALERKKLQDEARQLKRRIKYLTGLLASEAKRLQVVIEETEAIKQAYATPRRTVILNDEEQAAGMATAVAADLDKPQGPQVVALTTRGVTRADAAGFSYRAKEGVSSRAAEAHLSRFTLEPDDSLLLVSSRGRAWRVGVGRVPQKASFAELGLDKGETLVGGGVISPGAYLVIGTRGGNIKRVGVDDLKMGEASWAEIIGLGDRDEVLFAGLGSEQAEVMFFTAGGKANRFIAAQVNPQATPSARGVVGIKVAKGDHLVAGSVFEPDNKQSRVVVVSETGYGKQVKLSAFPVQGRGGQGVQSLELTKATGRVVAVAVTATEAQHCDVLSAKGLRRRVALDKLPLVDRRKRGELVAAFEKDDFIRVAALF